MTGSGGDFVEVPRTLRLFNQTIKLPKTSKGEGMNLQIEIECGECGLYYTQSIWEMDHGRYLKCPFCLSPRLLIKGQALAKKIKTPERFEKTLAGKQQENKIKL